MWRWNIPEWSSKRIKNSFVNVPRMHDFPMGENAKLLLERKTQKISRPGDGEYASEGFTISCRIRKPRGDQGGFQWVVLLLAAYVNTWGHCITIWFGSVFVGSEAIKTLRQASGSKCVRHVIRQGMVFSSTHTIKSQIIWGEIDVLR